MNFGCFDFRGELGFLNCNDVCICVVNKQFELLKFVFGSVYVDLQYDEIYLTFTAGSVCLCGVCSPVVVLSLAVVVPYVVSAVVAAIVMPVLLFVLHVSGLRFEARDRHRAPNCCVRRVIFSASIIKIINADSVIGCYFIESDLRQQTDSEMLNHQRNHLVTFICIAAR